jgi:hypothetical protein
MTPVYDRFISKIARTPCWEWQGTTLVNGYGQLKGDHKVEYAHRISYRLFRGRIPGSFVIDHLCRNRRCVNPLHLEAVSNKENLLRGVGSPARNARKSACKRGHPLSGDNLRVSVTKSGKGRVCRTCVRRYAARYYQDRKATKHQAA